MISLRKQKPSSLQKKTSASHQSPTSGRRAGNVDGVSKRWKIFLLPIWGSESKSAEKTVDARVGGWGGVAAAGRGRAAQRERGLLWRLHTKPGPQDHSPPAPALSISPCWQQIFTEGLLCTGHYSNTLQKHDRQNPCPRGVHTHVLFLRK